MLALSVTTLAGCASDPRVQDGIVVNDPYEAQNRRIHDFNKSIDAQVSRLGDALPSDGNDTPASGAMTPMDLVINMGANLSLPGKFANSVLQGRPEPAVKNLFRFAVNSTLGVAGMFDPAGRDFGLTETDTDFGETLAVWGVPEGAYLELPALGPSTQRDAVGKLVDVAIDPLWWMMTDRQVAVAYALRIAGKVGDRARFGDSIDSVLHDSADSYAQTRLIYLMHRRHDIGEESAEIDPYAEDTADAAVIDPYE
jgi:phospholipid-binding lipoprotein MlaA